MEKNKLFNIAETILMVVLIVTLSILVGFSQELPLEYHLSDDGMRLIRGNQEPDGFYSRIKVDTIYLQFDQTNYWEQLTNNYNCSTDLAAILTYKGVVFDSVGVRFKGMTSYMMMSMGGGGKPGNTTSTSEKKSFNITLDYVKDQDIDGYTTFNLNNCFEDPSFLREILYNNLSRKNIPSAKGNFVVLMINGQSWGIYANVQQLDKKHAGEWFLDDECTRWRGESPTSSFGGGGNQGGWQPGQNPGQNPGGGAGGGFGEGTSTLNDLGSDTTVYQENYTLKKAYKENPWDDLVNACVALNNKSNDYLIDSLGEYLDVDASLWFIAHEILFTDDDSYVNKGGMDYYIYFDEESNRIVPIEYDGNSSLSVKNVSWSPFLKAENVNYPLMNRLFAIPEYRQRYLAHVRTILNQSFVQSEVDDLIDKYAQLVDKHVSNDPKKIYTYSEFTSEISTLKSFFKQRSAYLWSNAEVKVQGTVISDVKYITDGVEFKQPSQDQEVTINANVSGQTGVKIVNLYYGKGLAGKFEKVEMFDDGLHGDLAATDGIFGATIPAHKKGKFVRYYIEAIAADNAGTRTYAPEGAEHDVFIYQVKIAETTQCDVVINEVMASNTKTSTDQDGEFDDWVEMYNVSAQDFDLSGYYLSDSGDDLSKWQFPDGTIISGNDYLIVWADKDTLQTGLHANFKLSSSGGVVYLVTPDLQIANQVIYNSYISDKGFARIPNGSGVMKWQVASLQSNNDSVKSEEPEIEPVKTIVITQNADNQVLIYPNPVSYDFNISTDSYDIQDISVFTLTGKKIFSGNFTSNLNINCENWPKGVYIVKLNTQNCKVVKL